MDDFLKIKGKKLSSRLFLGTGKRQDQPGGGFGNGKIRNKNHPIQGKINVDPGISEDCCDTEKPEAIMDLGCFGKTRYNRIV